VRVAARLPAIPPISGAHVDAAYVSLTASSPTGPALTRRSGGRGPEKYAHHLVHAPAVDDAGRLTDVVVEMAMELIAGPRQSRAASSTGNIAIERLHHAEDELPHVVAPPCCGVCMVPGSVSRPDRTDRASPGEAGRGKGGGKMQDAPGRPPRIALSYLNDFTCATN
jgi:hypothetical protein